ncbi:acyl-CoA N-acyltransferase [Lipomyces arxii]|uniref:acyl-CoA N-acyltransferase n=1 Tax=Lipomyces arxii TaxID=56418 RepID=UPI0034CD3D3F
MADLGVVEDHVEVSSSEEDEVIETSPVDGQAEAPIKKKKKRSKKKKTKTATASAEEVQRAEVQKPAVKSIEDLLRQLAMAEETPKTKTMAEYKFWRTQPVTKFDEKIADEGPIESKTVDQVPDEPYGLLKEFEWDTLDISKPDIITEVFELLCANYVEDSDSTFRFKYSASFLDWAFRPPDCRPEWYIGVRVAGTKKLVAFISGIPMKVRVRNTELKGSEVNFICVHKKLRSKRLAPLLIKEVTRRINKQNIWHALYTAGVVLPSPVSTCRYYHRSLNWSKLHDVGFSPLPPGKTKANMIEKYRLPENTKLEGLRLMERRDIDQIYDLVVTYLNKFELAQVFAKDELLHWLMHNHGTETKSNDENDPDRVIWTYVIEDLDGVVTDMFSFYKLPSTVIGDARHDTLNAAYGFYYASSTALDLPRSDKEGTAALKARLVALFDDALILCKKLGFDVFNALTLLDNSLFLDDLKFGAGDGYLNYYLFNYKAFPIDGGYLTDGTLDSEKRSGVAVVML